MTQLEFSNKFQTYEQMFVWVNEAEKKISELEDENAKLKNYETCDGCKFKPNQGENFYEPCGECSRFYSDQYTTKAP